MDTSIIKQCSSLSLVGGITFPEVISRLTGAGVERYMIDLGRTMSHYYGVKDESTSLGFEFKGPKIAEEFNTDEVKSAISDSQAGKIKYTEFLTRVMNAGCCRYEVFINSKKVIYCGRQGDQHVEAFPS